MAVIVEDLLLGLLSDARTLQALKGNGNGRARDSSGASVEEIALTVRKALAELEGRRQSALEKKFLGRITCATRSLRCSLLSC